MSTAGTVLVTGATGTQGGAVLRGILDRLDSVTFSAPLFFHLTRYWFT